jgi:hypothetical protein
MDEQQPLTIETSLSTRLVFDAAGLHGRCRPHVSFSNWFLLWVFFDREIRRLLIEEGKRAEDIPLSHFVDMAYNKRPGFDRRKYRTNNGNTNKVYAAGVRYWWRICFDPGNPFVIRVYNGQLRIMIRPGATVMACADSLMGYVEDSEDDAIEYLRANSYNSIGNWGNENAIMFGVLSYVDHDCDSIFAFTRERELRGEFVKPPTGWYNKRLTGITVHMVDTNDDGTKRKCPSKRKHQEEMPFLCRYGDKKALWFECECNQCKHIST